MFHECLPAYFHAKLVVDEIDDVLSSWVRGHD